MKKHIIYFIALLLMLLTGCSFIQKNTINTDTESISLPQQTTTEPTSIPSDTYPELIQFKRDNYSEESIAVFNSSLTKNDNLSNLLESYATVYSTLPTSDENYDFITITLAASLNELYCEEMNESTSYSSNVKLQLNPIVESENEKKQDLDDQQYEYILYAFYTINYEIIDSTKLTIGERDYALKTFCTEFQNYINELDEAKLSSDKIRELLSSKTTELATTYSSDFLVLSCTIDTIEIHSAGQEMHY